MEKKEEVGVGVFMELLNKEHFNVLEKMRTRHLAFIARHGVVGMIHKTVSVG